ncbi:flagellar assembly protein FliH [Clostridium sp. SYSU_GA19001]|uniref:FliH/SctL family protein n=1 Tax=Clostridium caldaquaticum TaxID=2940653 RepID=UPI0020770E13|nr:flagellar assembly protein FliH [Clostridium caldaquaticum]MCM8710971.1 flagellar assembly protein FliH [Clostridium caldaquaticum]
MQLSYNVIKNNSIKNSGFKSIVTEKEFPAAKAETEENIKNNIESYENLAKTMLENARRQSERILSKAYEEARALEEEASVKSQEVYERAYRQGYEEGYSKAYNEALKKAETERNSIVSTAEKLLKNAKIEYEKYLESKALEIKDLILTIAETVFKREVEAEDFINNMIFEALENSKNAKNFIIRCNAVYVEELKLQAESWKEQLGYIGDIFIVRDDSIEPGNALIDKGNGKVTVGVKFALEKMKAILEGKE